MKLNCKRESHSPNGDNSTVAEAPSQKRDKLKLKEEWQPLKNENVLPLLWKNNTLEQGKCKH